MATFGSSNLRSRYISRVSSSRVDQTETERSVHENLNILCASNAKVKRRIANGWKTTIRKSADRKRQR